MTTLKCQEAHDFLSHTKYFPCGQSALRSVYSKRDRRSYNMCEQHADHAVNNRGMIDEGEATSSNPDIPIGG